MADGQPQAQESTDHLNDFGKIAYQFLRFGQNATNNISQVFNEMSVKQWIRLIVIVGAYMLLRPYVLKHAAKVSVNRMEKEEKERKAAAAAISPNELREGKKKHDSDEEDSEDEGDSTATNWGAKARSRQRVLVKKLMKADEQRRQDAADDEDIADLLED